MICITFGCSAERYLCIPIPFEVKNRKQRYTVALLLCLTLGLAPFVPEPHLFGKVKWVFGGAEGMAPMDWFDLAMHGAPFLYLIYLLMSDLKTGLTASKGKKSA